MSVKNTMDEKPRLELSVPACRDCRFSVPGFNEARVEDEHSRALHVDQRRKLVGKPLYHLARAEAPLCVGDAATMRCAEPAAKLFKDRPEAVA